MNCNVNFGEPSAYTLTCTYYTTYTFFSFIYPAIYRFKYLKNKSVLKIIIICFSFMIFVIMPNLLMMFTRLITGENSIS